MDALAAGAKAAADGAGKARLVPHVSVSPYHPLTLQAGQWAWSASEAAFTAAGDAASNANITDTLAAGAKGAAGSAGQVR